MNPSDLVTSAEPTKSSITSPIDPVWRRVLFEENFQPAWIYDLQTLAFVDVNPAAIERYGYSRDEFLRMTLKDIRPPEDVPALLDRIANFETGRYTSGEWRHLRRDGSLIFAEVMSYDIDVDGRPCRLAIINDVTERHGAEEALKRTIQDYRGLFENAHDAILIIGADDEQRILDVNQRACAVYGFSRGEFLSMTLSDISPETEKSKENIRETLERGVRHHFDITHRRKDGSEMFLEINAAAITYKNQQAIVTVNRDVTERKRAERQQREEEQRRRLHVEQTPLGVIEWDANFCFRDINPGAERIFGFSKQEIVGKYANLIVPIDDQKEVGKVLDALLAARGGLRSTNRNITKDGRVIMCEWYNTPLIDEAGHVVGVASLVQDVTAMLQSQQALEDRERLYRTLAEAIPAIVYTADAERTIDYCNHRWYEYTGMEPGTVKGNWPQCVHPEDLPHVVKEGGRCAAKGEATELEYRMRRHDGTYRWFLSRSLPLRDENGVITRWIGLSTDIDDRKRAEEALEASLAQRRADEQKLREQHQILETIFNHVPVMVSFFDREGRYILVNRAWQESLGYSADELRQRDVLPELYPDPNVLARVREFIVRADGTWGEFPTRTRDGRVLETIWTDIRVPGGPIIGLGQDITQRKLDEHALRQSEERLRQIAENIEEIFWIMDPADRRTLYISPAYERIWQQSVPEIYASPDTWIESVHPDDRASAFVEDVTTGWDKEFRLLRKDGTVRWVASRAIPIRDATGRVYRVVGVTQDITERKEMEDQLRRHAHELNELVRERTERIRELERQRVEAEKVVATGRIAARIAHEINNPLAGIASAFQLIKGSVQSTDEYFPYVARVEREIDRISQITRQMYVVYRPETEAASELSVDDELRDACALLESQASTRRIKLNCCAGPADLRVKLPANALRQVLMNIIRNAIEASPDGASVEIGNELVGDDRIAIWISDHGPGIDPNHRSQIFEPFFTTKQTMPAAGLGLGLSVANSLVLAMGGHIELDTEVGRGTTFRIVLPTQPPKVSA